MNHVGTGAGAPLAGHSIGTFVWKVASRCNLNCPYCYVYNAGDDSWRGQPVRMTSAVAGAAARRILAHGRAHGSTEVNINLHGGEPLLGGAEHLRALLETIRSVFHGSGVEPHSTVQTNGLLVDDAIVSVLAEYSAPLLLSVDGPPDRPSATRLDHAGRATDEKVDERLRWLSATHPRVLGGVLTVVDPTNDPVQLWNYLTSFPLPQVDLLLPLASRARPPAGTGTYGPWLASLFDLWFANNRGIRIRFFETLLSRAMGLVKAGDPCDVRALIVETNGEWELDDTLKTTRPGAARTGRSVLDSSVDELLALPDVRDYAGSWALGEVCRSCSLLRTCGGGHTSHRWGADGSFAHPSVYCEDLTFLIHHMHARLAVALHPLGKSGRRSEK